MDVSMFSVIDELQKESKDESKTQGKLNSKTERMDHLNEGWAVEKY